MFGVRVCLIAAVVISQSGAVPPTGTDSNTNTCKAVDSRATDTWCNNNCNHTPSYCPAKFCKCSTGNDECLGKSCGEVCGDGVCDGNGFCVNAEENPCLQDGCSGKSCGEDCLSGDIVGTCNIDGNCDVNKEIARGSCSSQDECLGKSCGEVCGDGVCDGNGFCVNAEENPCLQDGCSRKSCGEDCLSGDIVGTCNIDGNCDVNKEIARASCSSQGVKCGKCYREAWCGYNQMVTARSCDECPLNKGSWYCAGGGDCRVKGQKPYKRCVSKNY